MMDLISGHPNEDRIVNSLVRLAKFVGTEILTLPIGIDSNRKGPYAYITGDGIMLRREVVEEDPDNTEVYLMHEIFHPVVMNHEKHARFSHKIMNIAEDYKINQLLEELFGYNIKRVKFQGIRNRNFDNLSIEQIAEIVRKHNNMQLVTSCGCSGVYHGAILGVVNHIRRKFSHKIDTAEPLFYCDRVDTDLFLREINKVRKMVRLREISVSLDHLLQGIWAALYMEKPVATPVVSKDIMRPSQVLAYSYPANRVREETVGKPSEAMMAAAIYLRKVDEDRWYISERVERANVAVRNILNKIAEIKGKGIQTRKRREKLIELTLKLRKKKKLRRSWRAKLPVSELMARTQLHFEKQTKPTVKPYSLKQFEEVADQIILPRFKGGDISKSLRSIARRSLVDLDRIKEMLDKIQDTLGIDIPEPEVEPEVEQEPEPEAKEAEPKLPPGEEESEVEDESDNEGSPTSEDEAEEEKDEAGKADDEVTDEKSDGAAIDDEPEPDQPRQDEDEDDAPNIASGKDPEGKGGSGEGKGQGGAADKTAIMELLFKNLDTLESILYYMNEIETQLKGKPDNRIGEGIGNDTKFNYGNDIERLVMTELAMLANPETELQFFVKYAEHSLLMHAPPDDKRTPVCICIDGSGSMSGEPYNKASGFALAMIGKLREDRRGVALMTFTTGIDKIMICGVDKPVDVMKALEIVVTPSYGGTEFDTPIMTCYNIKKQMGWKNMLILMVTDGHCQFSDAAHIMKLKTPGDRIVGIIVSSSTGEHLKPVLDEVYMTSKQGLEVELVKAGNAIL